jgi:hypothetical protein
MERARASLRFLPVWESAVRDLGQLRLGVRLRVGDAHNRPGCSELSLTIRALVPGGPRLAKKAVRRRALRHFGFQLANRPNRPPARVGSDRRRRSKPMGDRSLTTQRGRSCPDPARMRRFYGGAALTAAGRRSSSGPGRFGALADARRDPDGGRRSRRRRLRASLRRN